MSSITTTMLKLSTDQTKSMHQSLSSSCSSLGSCSSMASFMSVLLKENTSRMELAGHESLVIDIVDDNAKQCPDSETLNRCQSLVLMRGSRSKRRMCRWTHECDQRRTTAKNDPISKSDRHEQSNGKSCVPLPKASSDTMLLRLPQRKASPRITAKTKLTVVGGGGNNRSSHPSANAQWNLPKNATITSESTIRRKPNVFLDKPPIMPLENPPTYHLQAK